MEESHRQEYGWYMRGCSTLQWSPLEEAEFDQRYQLYRQAHGFLTNYDHRMAQASGLAKLFLQMRLAVAAHRMRRLEQSLGFLATAVFWGRTEDDGQGAGVPVVSVPPRISGQRAEPHPAFLRQ
jgi:hypothetical protein